MTEEQNTQITLDQLKSYLWGAAVLLRGQIDAAGYKEYIFPLVFFKRLCDVHDEEYRKFLKEASGDVEFARGQDYTFAIPDGAHWDDVRNTPENLGSALVAAFLGIERANPPMQSRDGRAVGGFNGIFGKKDLWTNKNTMPDRIIRSLLEHFSKLTLSLAACPADEMGTGYEYLIGQFADDAGHTAQEFYTNRTVVDLMAEILQPQTGESIYDPTCGSGGMLIKAITYVQEKGQDWQSLKAYGQELNALTSSIARMNLFLHGVEEFSVVNADTLEAPAFLKNGSLRKFDIVLANPPYSIKKWNRDAFSQDQYGRNFLGTPPQGRADYAFIQHILKSMDSRTGRCAILLPHGVLNRTTGEGALRAKLIEEDLVECVIGLGKHLFFNSPMEACVMICRSRKPLAHQGRILFINAKHLVQRVNQVSSLTPEHIRTIVELYRGYRNEEGMSAVATIAEMQERNNSLAINQYVKVPDEPEEIDLADAVDAWRASAIELEEALGEIENIFGGAQ